MDGLSIALPTMKEVHSHHVFPFEPIQCSAPLALSVNAYFSASIVVMTLAREM